MKTTIATFAFLTITLVSTSIAQTNICSWAKNGVGSSYDAAKTVTTDANNNVISGGWFYSPTLNFDSTVLTNNSNSGTHTDAFIVKYDATGNLQWAKSFGGNGDEGINSIVTDQSGNIYVLGHTSGGSISIGSTTYTNLGSGYNDLFLIKLDSQGTILWSKVSSGTYSETGEDLSIDSSGNLYLVGEYNSSSFTFGGQTITGAGGDSFLFKLNSDGTIIWHREIAGMYSINSCALTSNHSLVIVGAFSSATVQVGTYTLTNGNPYTSYDVFVGKYDTDGSVVWANSYGGSGNEQINSVTVSNDDNIYFTGEINSASVSFGGIVVTNSGTSLGFETDVVIAKMNQLGSVIWAKSAGNASFSESGKSIVTDINGDVYVVGGNDGPGLNFGLGALSFGGSNEIFMVTYDANGTAIFNQKIGGNSGENAGAIAIDNLGNILVAGDFSSVPTTFGSNAIQINSPNNSGDAFVAKFNANYVGLNEIEAEQLISIFPNPSMNAEVSIINSKLPIEEVNLIDKKGNVVFNAKNINNYQFSLQTKDIPEGGYIVKVQAEKLYSYKLVIVK